MCDAVLVPGCHLHLRPFVAYSFPELPCTLTWDGMKAEDGERCWIVVGWLFPVGGVFGLVGPAVGRGCDGGRCRDG